MTDDELRTKIAEALGWKRVIGEGVWGLWCKPNGQTTHISYWPNSLDSCFCDLVPKAKEWGYGTGYCYEPGYHEEWYFFNVKDSEESYYSYAPEGQPALAMCRAFLALAENLK